MASVVVACAICIAQMSSMAAAQPTVSPEPSCTVTVEDLQRWRQELIPLVEQRAGRTFKKVPDVVLATEAELMDMLAEEIAASMAAAPAHLRPADIPSTSRQVAERHVKFYKGKYSFARKAVVCRSDIVSSLAEANAEQNRETVRQVLAHELVHALQDQYVDVNQLEMAARASGVETPAISGLVEGHAILVHLLIAAKDFSGETQSTAAITIHQQLISSSASPDMDKVLRAQRNAFLYCCWLWHSANPRSMERVWQALEHPPQDAAAITETLKNENPSITVGECIQKILE